LSELNNTGFQQSHEEYENLRKLLEQHWLHCRHLESERAWFMNAYILILNAVFIFMNRGSLSLISFTFMSSKPSSPVSCSSSLLLLLIITFFGLLLNLRWIYAFEHHRERVNIIIKKIVKITWPELNTTLDLTMSIPKMEIWPKPLNTLNDLFSTRVCFPLFYLSILVYLVVLFLLSRSSPTLRLLIVFVFLLFPLYFVLGWYFSLKKIKEIQKDETVKNWIR